MESWATIWRVRVRVMWVTIWYLIFKFLDTFLDDQVHGWLHV